MLCVSSCNRLSKCAKKLQNEKFSAQEKIGQDIKHSDSSLANGNGDEVKMITKKREGINHKLFDLFSKNNDENCNGVKKNEISVNLNRELNQFDVQKEPNLSEFDFEGKPKSFNSWIRKEEINQYGNQTTVTENFTLDEKIVSPSEDEEIVQALLKLSGC